MKVNEIATLVQLTPSAVRFYARIGLLRPRRHSVNRYRIFGNEDVIRLRIINFAKSLGLRLPDIAEMLRQVDLGIDTHAWIGRILNQRRLEIQQTLNELTQLKTRLEGVITCWTNTKNPAAGIDALHACLVHASGTVPRSLEVVAPSTQAKLQLARRAA